MEVRMVSFETFSNAHENLDGSTRDGCWLKLKSALDDAMVEKR